MSQINVDTIKSRTGGAPTLAQGVVVSAAATFGGNVSIAGTLTYEDVTNVDSIGIITARSGIVVSAGGVDITSGGLNVTAGVSTFAGITTVTGQTLFSKQLNVSGVSTFNSTIDIEGAVETVSVGSTYNISTGRIILECDALNGTVFTHDLAAATNVGIVSLRNFPVTKNSVTTFTIIFTQNSTGTGNTTAATGIGTFITLTPIGVSGFSTSARVATASTVTLSTTANDVDIVTLAVHYNGSGTGTPGNYRVFATGNTGFRLGNVRP